MQIHLLIDSPFYTDRIIEKMSLLGLDPKLFVTIKSHNVVEILDEKKKTTLKLNQLGSWLLKREISSVYIHFLSSSVAYILYKTQLVKKPCYWIMWGADFYGLPAFSDQYYLPLSKPFAWKNDSWKQKLAQFLGLPSSKYVMKIFKEIEFFVGYEEEYKLTQMALSHEMKFIPWEYYFSIDELEMPAINQGKGAILLGNSDDPMNNHLDTLEKLETVVEEGQKIIIPVAGAKVEYLSSLKIAQSRSKAEIILVEKYMISEDFFAMMDEVSYVVYGHLRQQGVGTILPLLFAGKKAFLWEGNPLKNILERWGMEINLIDELSSKDFNILTQDQVKLHRENLAAILSVEQDFKRWKRILNN